MKTLEIPKEIRFMSSTYKVVMEPGFNRNANGNNSDNYQAIISYKRNEIKLDPELPNVIENLFHELTHMVCHHLSIEMEEKDVERFGEGLKHLLIENELLK